MEMLKNMHRIDTSDFPKLSYSLERFNNALYISLFTNVTSRPIRLIVDTGAAITLVASDIVKSDVPISNCKLDICGVTGQENLIQSEGTIFGLSSIENKFLGTTMHLMDRKFCGPADGYLGFDFLSQHKAIIDIDCAKIYFNVENLTKEKKKLEPITSDINCEGDNLIHILGNSYDFSDTKIKNNKNNKVK